MKKFEFSLQKLLDVKNALERVAEERLACAVREAQKTRERLQELSGRRQQIVGEIEGLNGAATQRHKIGVHLRYLERVQARITSALERLVEQEMTAEQYRQELCAIVRERKSLEKLSDHEHSAWMKEARRVEQKQMDEFAVNGFLRRQVEVAVEG